MATIVFPTRSEERCPMGEPVRARGCWCPTSLVDADRDSCTRCGHWLEATIGATWRLQARRMARRERELVA